MNIKNEDTYVGGNNEAQRLSTQAISSTGNELMTAYDSVAGEYPHSWTKDPLRAPNNMYASRLSQMLQRNAANGKYRAASKSQVQLVHTLSIYGQINVPICEINRLYGLTPTNNRNKRSMTADGRARNRS